MASNGSILAERPAGQKPYLVFAATPAEGHAGPMIRIAADLIKNRGFEGTFICGESLKSSVAKTGASFVPCPEMFTPELIAQRETLPQGMVRMLWDLENCFVAKMPERWVVLKQVLEDIREQRPMQEVIVVSEFGFQGTLPLFYNCPLPKGYTTRPKVVLLGVSCYIADSIDVAPFGSALPFDNSESGRMRTKVIRDLMLMGPFAAIDALTGKLLSDLGGSGYVSMLPTQLWYTTSDATLQLCPPSIEYPISDRVPHVKFAGGLPPVPVSADFVPPPFWDEVTGSQKPVVVVTQGTVSTNLDDLLLPTIKALGERDDILVVAVLGARGATLDPSVEIPANTRVVDYLNYDAVLPHTSVFVMNGGYGGVMHAVSNAVPLVVAGGSEDKPEVAMRVEYTGAGINLRTGTPTPAQIAEAVTKVLKEPSFKKVVSEMKAENEKFRALDIVEATILEQATGP